MLALHRANNIVWQIELQVLNHDDHIGQMEIMRRVIHCKGVIGLDLMEHPLKWVIRKCYLMSEIVKSSLTALIAGERPTPSAIQDCFRYNGW